MIIKLGNVIVKDSIAFIIRDTNGIPMRRFTTIERDTATPRPGSSSAKTPSDWMAGLISMRMSGIIRSLAWILMDALIVVVVILLRVRCAKPSRNMIMRISRKTLVFCYDPGGRDDPLPSILLSGSDRILISIPEVSSVSFQAQKWLNMSIEYSIGRIRSGRTSVEPGTDTGN
jgi:hypothetical protein